MWLALQKVEANDYVIATGKLHSVRDFLEMAFKKVGLNYTISFRLIKVVSSR